MLKELIKELRTKNNLTMKAFGESIGVSGAAVSNYESGRKQPGQETLARISEVYDISKEWLMGEVNETKEAAKMLKTAVEIAAPVVAEELAEQAAAAGQEVKKAVKVSTRQAEETQAPTNGSVKECAPKKTSAPELIIESLFGGQITAEEILRKVPKEAEKVYVKPDENKAYWSGDGKVGSVDLW